LDRRRQSRRVGPRPNLIAQKTIDATGLIVCPGLSIARPSAGTGLRRDETIASGGSERRCAGASTSVSLHADTQPAIDSQAAAEFVYLLAERAPVWQTSSPSAPVTKIAKAKSSRRSAGSWTGGAVAFTDHDAPIAAPTSCAAPLEYCRMFDKPVLCHAETRI